MTLTKDIVSYYWTGSIKTILTGLVVVVGVDVLGWSGLVSFGAAMLITIPHVFLLRWSGFGK